MQLDHPDALDLLGTMSIYRRFQNAGELLRDQQGEEQTKNAGARLESTNEQRHEPNHDEQRRPDLDVAERGHEQIERRIRPAFIDEMKNRLVHACRFTIRSDRRPSNVETLPR